MSQAGPDVPLAERPPVPPPAPSPRRTVSAGASSHGAAVWQWVLMVVWTLALVAFVAVPVGLLHPFRPQTRLEVGLAYEMRRMAPWLTTLGLVPLAGLVYLRCRGRRVRWRLVPIGLLFALAGAATWFARQNHFEWMFNPLPQAVFAHSPEATFAADTDMVLAVDAGTDAVAYPVLQMAYHHLVMDVIAGEPVVATYCTLCHTGLVWKRTMDGRVLTFRLYGINNQNMLMRDDQTGSWWQQATGFAIQGPLRGRRLEPVVHSEVMFAVFRREHPGGRVLRPDPTLQALYAPANWEKRMHGMPTVVDRERDDTLTQRTHVLGIALGRAAKAYPFFAIRKGGPVNDRVGGVPVVVVVGDDRKSARVFERTVDGRPLEFVAKAGVKPIELSDLETASDWDFAGRAIRGPLAGRRLTQVWASKQYWFDWKLQRPHTALFAQPTIGS